MDRSVSLIETFCKKEEEDEEEEEEEEKEIVTSRHRGVTTVHFLSMYLARTQKFHEGLILPKLMMIIRMKKKRFCDGNFSQKTVIFMNLM